MTDFFSDAIYHESRSPNAHTSRRRNKVPFYLWGKGSQSKKSRLRSLTYTTNLGAPTKPKDKKNINTTTTKPKRKKPKSITPRVQTTIPVNSTAYTTIDPAIKQLYIKEIKRLTLTLVKSSKDLLLSYNFSGINKVPSYYLESDLSARASAIFTESSAPQSLSISINELDNNRLMTDIVNTINLAISDYVLDTTKIPYFTMVISGGLVFYDLNLPITTQDTTPFYVKVFKIPDATGVV